MHSRSPTSSALSLREFAEAPDAHLPPPEGARVVDEPRFYATFAPKWVGVCRLDFPASETAAVLAEIRELAAGVQTEWMTSRDDIAQALRDAGARAPDPPLEPSFTALGTEDPPPPVDGVDVRPIETFEQHVTGLEIEHAAAAWTEEAKERRLREAREAYERRRRRPGGQWLAYLDGEPVAWGSAIAGPRGLYLSGGATIPEARGRGAYRALLRVRWDFAVAQGTPALAVGAQETSLPILERCGFQRFATMHELVA
jgi:GNAT superfamily N-acetyltransferase